MVHWNIFQLVTWLDRCVARIYTEMLIETKKSQRCRKDWKMLVQMGG